MADDIDFSVETFTPEHAYTILQNTNELKVNFRRPLRSQAFMLSESMKAGTWVWTDAPPIRIGALDGREVVYDGQHRLLGCWLSKVPLRSMVIRNLDAGIHIDRGRPRTDAQILEHHGYKNAALLSVVARRYLGIIIAAQRGLGFSYAVKSLVQTEDIIDLCRSRELPITKAPRSMNAASYVVARMVLDDIDHDLAADFWTELADPVVTESPQYALRASAALQHSRTGRGWGAERTYSDIIKAWDLSLVGGKLRMWKQNNASWPLPSGHSSRQRTQVRRP
jgi:hypothetical protein